MAPKMPKMNAATTFIGAVGCSGINIIRCGYCVLCEHSGSTVVAFLLALLCHSLVLTNGSHFVLVIVLDSLS